MIPWNPIHRYAGMTSLFDELDERQPRDVPQSRLDGWGPEAQQELAQRDQPERTPLGFIDVRAAGETNRGSDDADQTEADAEGATVFHSPSVGFTQADDNAVGAVDQAADEKVPFYKREISFGRKKNTPQFEVVPDPVEPEPVLELSVADEPAAEVEAVQAESEQDARVPFYKRDLSFRRKTESDELATNSRDEAVDTTVEPFVLPQAFEPEVELEPIAETVELEEPQVEESLELLEPSFELEPVAFAQEPQSGAVDVDHAATTETLAFADQVASDQVADEPEPFVELEPVTEPETGHHEIPAAIAKVPLHKREFGKSSKTGAQKKGRGGRRTGRKLVGLKIGASQLAAAVVQEGDNGFELIELARTPLEPGIVLDGEVRDAEALVSALRAFFADQKLPTRDVRIGLASNRIGVRTFEITGIDQDERFDNAVRFKAHEVLPIAASDSVLDYRVLEERQSEAGETIRRILLVVAPRDQVAPYVEAAQKAGLKLDGIDLEALGLLRTFVEPNVERTAGGTSTVVVAIGHEASTLLVSGGGTCEFTRVFDWGGATLQDAIAQELDVHPAEAATILRHLSLSGNSRRVEGIDDEALNRALEAVRLRLTPFARELVSSLQFYQTQPESLGIGEIILTGGTSQLDGLAGALNQMIGVQVRLGDPLQRLTVRKGVESGFEQSLGSLAVPIGLAIDDDPVRSVDLTPRDVVTQRRSRSLAPTVLIPAAAIVPLAVLGLMFSQAHGKVSDRKTELSSLQAQLASLPEPKEPTIDAGLQGAEAARASAVAQVLGGRTSWDGMLRDLSRVLPDNIWLTGLKAAVPTPMSTAVAPATGASTKASGAPAATTTATTVATGVTITGFTFDHPDVAVLLSRLVALPTLNNVQLVSSVEANVGKRSVIQFTILANLRGVGGGA